MKTIFYQQRRHASRKTVSYIVPYNNREYDILAACVYFSAKERTVGTTTAPA